MPAANCLVTDGDHDACRLARFQDNDDSIGLGTFEVWVDELITTPFRCLDDRMFRSPGFYPLFKLLGDCTQCVPGHRVKLSVGIKESDYPFRLLERLNEAIEQDPVEAAVAPRDPILVMIVEGVHERLPTDGTSAGPCRSLFGRVREKGYQGRSPWLGRCHREDARQAPANFELGLDESVWGLSSYATPTPKEQKSQSARRS
jgi:hypothetical protein